MKPTLFEPPRRETGPPQWAVTYADLMSLLLVFFVLIASYSSLDVVKYRSLVGSVQNALGTRDRTLADPKLDSAPTQGIASAAEERERRWVEQEVESMVQELGGPFAAAKTEDGLRVRVDGSLLFDPGRADLKDDARDALAKLLSPLRNYPYEIHVEGHTDNVPIATAAFPSNWELSAARASSVVRFLLEKAEVPRSRVLAVGMADSRPLASNDTPEGRRRNRRVEFLLSTPAQRDREEPIGDQVGPYLQKIESTETGAAQVQASRAAP